MKIQIDLVLHQKDSQRLECAGQVFVYGLLRLVDRPYRCKRAIHRVLSHRAVERRAFLRRISLMVGACHNIIWAYERRAQSMN